MKSYSLIGWVIVLSATALTSACSGPAHMIGKPACPAQITLAKNGQPCAAIVVGEQATRTEWIAAQELAKYVKAITGAELPVTIDPAGGRKVRNLILIGQPSTNAVIEKLGRAGDIALTAEKPGLDGFIIKSVTADKKNCLVLASAQPRGCLYAVYHLLETEAKVGFFPL